LINIYFSFPNKFYDESNGSSIISLVGFLFKTLNNISEIQHGWAHTRLKQRIIQLLSKISSVNPKACEEAAALELSSSRIKNSNDISSLFYLKTFILNT